MAGNIVTQMVSGMQTSLSNFFQGFLKGEIRSAKQLFVEWGNFVIKIISDVIAQWITAQIMTGLGSLFAPSIAGAGTTVNAFAGVRVPGMQEGAESIPYTGLFRLHEGEKVTPRHSSDNAEKTNLTIYNMITNEAVAAAMAGKEGSGVIVNTINMNSLRNGVVRREVVKR
jgi:hypothetical protein